MIIHCIYKCYKLSSLICWFYGWCLEFYVQDIKRTLATDLALMLPFRPNASFTRPGFGPTGSFRLSLDKLVSHRRANISSYNLGLRPALNSQTRRRVAVRDVHNLRPVSSWQLNRVECTANRRVRTLRFLYIRLPPWDYLALQF